MMKLKATEKIETVQVTFTLPKEMVDNYAAFCRHFECDKNYGMIQIMGDAMKGFDPNSVEKTPRTAPKNGKNGVA